MLAASFRSCFGTCFKRFGNPDGYDSIEDSLDECLSPHSVRGSRHKNGCLARRSSLGQSGLDYRSKSTSEIFRSRDYYFSSDVMRPEKRAFSASFGYLDANGLWESCSEVEVRSNATSAADIRSPRSDVSEAFWSCRGSVSKSSIQASEQDFYSDESEEPHEHDLDAVYTCEGCGQPGKHHDFDDHDKCNWRESSLNSSLPIPKSQKWIQLE